MNDMRQPGPGANYDVDVVRGFGREWNRFDHLAMDTGEALDLFNRYFALFPWEALPPGAIGFDAGCGSGRWARFVAPRVGRLFCVDASADALNVASRALSGFDNCELHLSTIDSMPLPDESADFGYSLGVLHHIPDTISALRACVRKLRPGAPFLLYLYYAFDNRPFWFRAVWKTTDYGRRLLSRCPFPMRSAIADVIAVTVYLPLARAARLAERLGFGIEHVPLAAYRDKSLYVMRTDALDRFGTRLEKRFTRDDIHRMMREAGLTDVRFSAAPPYWVAVGRKAAGTG